MSYANYNYGEIDYANMKLFNQGVWDADPKRAKAEALDAVRHGGFGEDCIRREVGNYEGQLMAIRRGWVTKEGSAWRINDAGKQALVDAGMPPFVCLPAIDSWHGTKRHYFVREREYRGEKCLQLAKEVFPAFGGLCMDPILNKEQAIALRDYIDEWVSRP